MHLIRQSSQNNAAASEVSSKHSSEENFCPSSNDPSIKSVSQCLGNNIPMDIDLMLKENRICLNAQESLSLEAAHSLIATLRDQMVPFSTITSQTSPWEQRSMAVRLAQKLQKAKRNKRWRKRKRKYVAELLQKVVYLCYQIIQTYKFLLKKNPDIWHV